MVWCFDCEVFCKDWMFVFIDSEDSQKRKYIVNDANELRCFYNENKDEIFAGYNARSYDQFIWKAILCGINPKKVNDYIIVEGKKGGTYSSKFKDYPLLIYDCMIDKMKSLKQLEGFMGNDIRETSVDFNINRKLTRDELELTLKYCIHDVEQTIEVFKRQPEEFESQTSLVSAFNLPKEYVNKTKAQLSSIILEAKSFGNRFDEFNISFPDTLVLSDKYKYIYDWYNQKINRNYFMSLKTKVYGVKHIFAWGGIHGAIPNYVGEGFYVMSDVASLYPSIMIEYNYNSRNIPDSTRYKQIRDTRLELKKAKNPMQLPYKIVLNSTYGATKDRYNQLYDPLMANNVCVAGQMLLLDLIDKLEQAFGDTCELIQSNTDGILMKLPSKESYDDYIAVCDEWSKRTRLNLEHDIYVKVVQKDVNNYIITSEDGHYKSKGAYVKKLKELDYDLPIVNKALVNKLTKDEPIEETINGCNHLKEFQKIIKIGKDYEYGMHGNKKLDERVLRVFASNKEDDDGIFKYRHDSIAKVGNTPEHAFIYNDDVNGLAVTPNLDKSWYVDLANKRLDDFMSVQKSDVKLDVYEIDYDECNTFTEVIEKTFAESNCKRKEFNNLILLNYFYKYGSIKQLLKIQELYFLLYGKDSILKERIEKAGINVSYVAKFGRETKKSITKFRGTDCYEDLISKYPADEFSLNEISELQLKEFKYVSYINESYQSGVCCVTRIEDQSYPKRIDLVLRSFKTGKSAKFYVRNYNIDDFPLKVGSVIRIGKYDTEYERRYVGKDEHGNVIYEENKDFKIYHLKNWTDL